MGAFAEFERELIRERQREGIALAKQRGAYRGRKPALNSTETAELRRRVEAREPKAALAREFGISPSYLELIETAERQPDAAIRRALARALSVSGWSDPS